MRPGTRVFLRGRRPSAMNTPLPQEPFSRDAGRPATWLSGGITLETSSETRGKQPSARKLHSKSQPNPNPHASPRPCPCHSPHSTQLRYCCMARLNPTHQPNATQTPIPTPTDRANPTLNPTHPQAPTPTNLQNPTRTPPLTPHTHPTLL